MVIIPLLILQQPKATAYHPECPFYILFRACATLKQNPKILTLLKSQNSETNRINFTIDEINPTTQSQTPYIHLSF